MHTDLSSNERKQWFRIYLKEDLRVQNGKSLEWETESIKALEVGIKLPSSDQEYDILENNEN